MPETIHITPEKVWGYFFDHFEELQTKMHLIAENPDFGIEIYVTEDESMPQFVVQADSVQVYVEDTYNEKDCTRTAQEIYDDYLTEKVINKLLDPQDDDDDESVGYDDYEYEDGDLQESIDDREATLEWAMREFLEIVLDSSNVFANSEIDLIVEDCLDHILEYVARKHGVDIYRPMWIEYDDGEVECEDYPYDKLVFDDEDNPIYAK